MVSRLRNERPHPSLQNRGRQSRNKVVQVGGHPLTQGQWPSRSATQTLILYNHESKIKIHSHSHGDMPHLGMCRSRDTIHATDMEWFYPGHLDRTHLDTQPHWKEGGDKMRLVAPQRCDFDSEEEFLDAMDAWDSAMDDMIAEAEDAWCEKRYFL